MIPPFKIKNRQRIDQGERKDKKYSFNFQFFILILVSIKQTPNKQHMLLLFTLLVMTTLRSITEPDTRKGALS